MKLSLTGMLMRRMCHYVRWCSSMERLDADVHPLRHSNPSVGVIGWFGRDLCLLVAHLLRMNDRRCTLLLQICKRDCVQFVPYNEYKGIASMLCARFKNQNLCYFYTYRLNRFGCRDSKGTTWTGVVDVQSIHSYYIIMHATTTKTRTRRWNVTCSCMD